MQEACAALTSAEEWGYPQIEVNTVLHLNRTENQNSSPSGEVSAAQKVVPLDDARWKDPAQMKQYIDKLLAQNQELTEQKSALEAHIQEIINSKSWKLTRPLRAFFEFSRAVRPLWRKRVFSFRPRVGDALRSESTSAGETFHLSGTSPSLDLAHTDERCPNGWCLIRTRMRSEQAHLASFLYYQTAEGFSHDERVMVESRNGSTSEKLFRFPPQVKAFKLDPFDLKKPVGFDLIEVREVGTLQVLAHFFRKHVLSQIGQPRILWNRVLKAIALYREGGLLALRIKFFADDLTNNYQEWVRRFDTIDEAERGRMREYLEKLEWRPLISLVMPTYNTPEKWLRLAIESVRQQAYPNWELCIADDASTERHVRPVLEEYAALDSRIRFTIREKNGHIAQASNSALELATGEFIGLLDHDDELTEDALLMVISALNANRSLDLIYSDEDKKTSHGMRFNPHFKSDWNPELLLSQNYVCHFTVIRADVIRQVGGFRAGTEGAQDWDLIWRVADHSSAERICHIPHVLYHWRVIEGSTAQSTDFKPYVLEAQVRAVSDHLERVGVKGAQVEILREISHLRVRFPIPDPAPLVSLIIPTRDKVDILRVCVDSLLEKTTYTNYEILVVDNGSVEPETLEYFEKLKADPRVRIVEDRLPFNFSRINNHAVRSARGSLLGFLNNDLEVINPEWLNEMVSRAVRPEVGGVGAQLWYPSELLQHAGIILGIGGVAGHNQKGRRRGDPGYFNRVILPQNLSAVTAACLIMRKDIFDQIEGFNEQDFSVAFNDVDLCLRIIKAGYQIVYDPYAELYHHESASRGYENTPDKFLRFEGEIERMKQFWGPVLKKDPYYNPNLTLLSEDFAFAFPPRQEKPWNR